MSDVVKVRLNLRTEEAEREKSAAKDTADYEIEASERLDWKPASPMQEARFVDPVTMIVAGTVAVLAVRMVNHWLKSDERGVQIDMRTVPATISLLENVPAGTIVRIDEDGNASIDKQQYDDPEDFLSKLKSFLSIVPADQ